VIGVIGVVGLIGVIGLIGGIDVIGAMPLRVPRARCGIGSADTSGERRF
jgi:hypothetical protein